MNTLALLAIIANTELNLGLPPGLLQSICRVESGLNPHAVVEQDGRGKRGSYGLCQIQHRTANHIRTGVSVKELLEPTVNIRLAGEYLTYNYRNYGSWVGAAIAYNRGSWGGGCTNDYFRKVTTAWKEINEESFNENTACRERQMAKSDSGVSLQMWNEEKYSRVLSKQRRYSKLRVFKIGAKESPDEKYVYNPRHEWD